MCAPASVAAIYRGQLGEAATGLREACRAADEQHPDDPYLRAHLLGSLAIALTFQGRSDHARETASAAAHDAERSGSPSVRAWAAYVSGEVLTADDPTAAAAEMAAALTLAREARSHFVEGLAAHASASLAARHGTPHAALQRLGEALDLWYRAGAWTHAWTTLRSIADVLAEVGVTEEAVVLWACAGAADEASAVFGEGLRRTERLGSTAREALGDARAAQLEQLGAHLSRDDAVQRALRAIRRARDELS